MQTSWLSDFMRQSLLLGAHGDHVVSWASLLIESLRDSKPDHELHILGVSRVPKMPNFLLGSTKERFESGHPFPIKVNEKTAEIFLSPTREGIRFLREEMPLTVSYESPRTNPPKRTDLVFYEAICFDGPKSSIIFALILPDCELNEFLASDELAELFPIICAQGIPLYELQMMREAYRLQQVEMDLMMGALRESNPELARIGLTTPAPVSSNSTGAPAIEFAFLQYVTQELRAPLAKVIGANEQLVEYCRTTLGSTDASALAASALEAADGQLAVLKNLNNIAMLMNSEIRPRTVPIGMQTMLRVIQPRAIAILESSGIRVKVEEHTRNVYFRGDQDTLLKMVERLLAFTATHVPRGGEVTIRTEDSGDRVEANYLLLEIEDTGEIPRDVSPTMLLSRQQLLAMTHPRLRRGGGVLYQLLTLYQEKCGGRFKIVSSPRGCFTCQFLLPVMSRSEVLRIRGSDNITGF